MRITQASRPGATSTGAPATVAPVIVALAATVGRAAAIAAQAPTAKALAAQPNKAATVHSVLPAVPKDARERRVTTVALAAISPVRQASAADLGMPRVAPASAAPSVPPISVPRFPDLRKF